MRKQEREDLRGDCKKQQLHLHFNLINCDGTCQFFLYLFAFILLNFLSGGDEDLKYMFIFISVISSQKIKEPETDDSSSHYQPCLRINLFISLFL